MNMSAKNPISEKTMQKYQIVYLNGGSSVGKSTLARLLQYKLADPFLVIGIDQIIYMMPEKLNNFADVHGGNQVPGFSWQEVHENDGRTAFKIHIGPFGKRMIQAFKDVVVALARSGLNIIIDDVSFGKDEVDAWRQTLSDFRILWVGVTAPIEIIEAREKERGDRKIGSARWQADKVHVGVHYDIMLNTHEKSLDEDVALLMDAMKKE